ncbi:gamma carbonic anhydrase family protein [Ectothiorhodospiraceae bacterium 2226]|nr:gamma carbonic anhydrase family protein [Ectothiorhodospiraceae bacterium 2226]
MSLRAFDGRHPELATGAWVDASALVVGAVSLGADASVWPMAVARGDVNRIEIGARTNIQDASVLHVTHAHGDAPGYPLSIGAEVTVGHRVVLHGCSIGERCLIGMGAVVMDGAVLEPYVLLGAASVVPPGRRLEGGYLWLGSPARRVRPLRAEERAWIEYSAGFYVELKNRHAAG